MSRDFIAGASSNENNCYSGLICFPEKNAAFSCPVCGCSARVINTDAARSWAEIKCENCSTYALKSDALDGVAFDDMHLLSGFFRYVRHEPMCMQVDSKKTVVQHIETTRQRVTRDFKIRKLLRYYYQRMDQFDQMIPFEKYPAIAYAIDIKDLMDLVEEGDKKGYLKYETDMITITRTGQEFLNSNTEKKPTVFISYNWGSNEIADELERRLVPYADVKRDKSCVKPWGNLTDFMKSIRDQDYVVLIISDSYMKSDACLYEVFELMKEKRWDERAMYIVCDDAHNIYNTDEQIEYIKYWEDKTESLRNKIKDHDPAKVTVQAEELKKYEKISYDIGSFMGKVKNSFNPDLDKAIEAVVARVRGIVLTGE